MQLTPLHARGKRGAPPKNAKHRPNGKGPKRDGKDDKKAKDTEKHLSRLEQLPVEVLERILVLCENLVLPRCSRTMYHKLSGESVKQQLVITAFGPTWDRWYGIPVTGVQSYHGWKTDYARIGGDPKFQSSVLNCSWARFETIFSAYETWIRQHAADRPIFHHGAEFRRTHFTTAADPTVVTMRRIFLNNWSFFESQASAKFQDPWFVAHMPEERYLDVHPRTRIPDVLLEGSFDWDMARRLFWLRWGGATVNADSQSWELTRAGFRNLVHPGMADLGLARVLISLFGMFNIYFQWPNYVMDEELERLDQMEISAQRDEAFKGEFSKFRARLRGYLRDRSNHPAG